MFRILNEQETEEAIQWARDNYDPGTEINPLWHPVVTTECSQMQIELLDHRTTLTKKKIDDIFAKAKHQHEYWEALYRVALPDLDNIEHISNWPEISEATSSYIMLKAIAFDREHHPEVMSGGLWMNSGFSVLNKNVPDWRIDARNVNIQYKESK